MRGLKKHAPPTDVSPSGQAAQTWKQVELALAKGLATAADRVEFARSTFDGMEKRKLREVMYPEQGGLCVYCERRIAEGTPTLRIDHWQPLSEEPTLAVHWRNLYLSCATRETCDCRKGDTRLRAVAGDADLPWPVDHTYEHCVGFTSLGEVYVRSDAPLTDAQRRALVLALGAPHTEELKDNGVLNLNHPRLVAAREAALDNERWKLRRQYGERTATAEERATRRSAMLRDRPLPEFVSIRARWLDRSLGKSR